MIIHRVPTSPRAWIPRNQRRSQKRMITTGSTILSPKCIWLKPISLRTLFNMPNKVPIRSQSSNWGCLLVGLSMSAQLSSTSLRGEGWVSLPSSCKDKVQNRLCIHITVNGHLLVMNKTAYEWLFLFWNVFKPSVTSDSEWEHSNGHVLPVSLFCLKLVC